MKIDLPEDADEDETAAIAAAVNAYVRAQMQATTDEEADGEPRWADRRWSFAGRIGGVQRRRIRVPRYAPRDPWTASGRTRRMR